MFPMKACHKTDAYSCEFSSIGLEHWKELISIPGIAFSNRFNGNVLRLHLMTEDRLQNLVRL
jgi:hypothetical protein